MSKSISAGSHGPRSQSKPYGLAFPLLGEGALGVNAQVFARFLPTYCRTRLTRSLTLPIQPKYVIV